MELLFLDTFKHPNAEVRLRYFDSDPASRLRDPYKKSLGVHRLFSSADCRYNASQAHPLPQQGVGTVSEGKQRWPPHFSALSQALLSLVELAALLVLPFPSLSRASALGLEKILVLRFTSGCVWEGSQTTCV